MSATVQAPRNILWTPQEGPQSIFVSCPIEDVFFGGARGGGKSDGLLGDWLGHQMEYGKNARGILFRRNWPEFDEIILRSNELFPPVGAYFKAGDRSWIFRNGARLKFRSMDTDQDADKYQGLSHTWLGFDELPNWPDPLPVDKLRATLRSVHGIPCVSRSTGNPGGVGHEWVKGRYILPSRPFKPFYDDIRKTWRIFIPSKLSDNKKLIENDPTYIDRLYSSGPPWLVRAWLEGDWDAQAGESFFTEQSILIEGRPCELPNRVDRVFAVIDTALKDTLEHDGTAVIYFAKNNLYGIPLIILDWDVIQIEGSLLEAWLPNVNRRLEEFAGQLKARYGSAGMWIEDKASGIVLLQQAVRKGLPAYPIDSKLTALGKEARAVDTSGYWYSGKVKISQHAYDKVTNYRGQTRNHFLSQVCGFRLGMKTPHNLDLLDCATYGMAIGLGNSDGY
jgi:phage terminase large subunit-like protein